MDDKDKLAELLAAWFFNKTLDTLDEKDKRLVLQFAKEYTGKSWRYCPKCGYDLKNPIYSYG